MRVKWDGTCVSGQCTVELYFYTALLRSSVYPKYSFRLHSAGKKKLKERTWGVGGGGWCLGGSVI